jgi:NAD(P)-dependent dehydrogenase (short-subunit alcohol dehydrogenase family)
MYEAPAYLGSEKLRDMVALVTGGDSGIGRAVAVLFARAGADVAIAYLNEHRDAAETKRAVEKEGRRCIMLSGDVADPRFCKSAVRKTVDVFGKLDILVNNAAFQEHVNKLEDLSDEHFDLTIKTNLYGVPGSKGTAGWITGLARLPWSPDDAFRCLVHCCFRCCFTGSNVGVRHGFYIRQSVGNALMQQDLKSHVTSMLRLFRHPQHRFAAQPGHTDPHRPPLGRLTHLAIAPGFKFAQSRIGAADELSGT